MKLQWLELNIDYLIVMLSRFCGSRSSSSDKKCLPSSDSAHFAHLLLLTPALEWECLLLPPGGVSKSSCGFFSMFYSSCMGLGPV